MTVNIKSLLRKAREKESVAADSDCSVKASDADWAKLELKLSSEPSRVVEDLSQEAGISGVRILNGYLTYRVCEIMYEYIEKKEPDFVLLRGRRCLPLGGVVTADGLVAESNIPNWLNAIMDDVYFRILESLGFEKPNHALVNVYEPGEGIMAHEDGPLYSGYALILSLGSGCSFDFVTKTDRSLLSQIYLPVGSVLLFSDNAYASVLHQFDFKAVDDLGEGPNKVNLGEIRLNPDTLGRSRIVDDRYLYRGKRISITLRHVSTVGSLS